MLSYDTIPPARKGPRPLPVAVLFWRHVSKSDACWLWTSRRDHQGYGILRVRHSILLRAHRISWQLHYGDIPNGLVICHRCDVRACVRPDHLFLGTLADNVADMDAKGRRRNPRVTLTIDQVREIRSLYVPGVVTQKALAERFGVGADQISRIINRHRWSDMEG